MSGDHNMNQVHMNQAKQIRPRAEGPGLTTDTEQYQSEIERQVLEMRSAIHLLNSTVETLRHRLKPVLCERPQREPEFALSGTASPLGLALQQDAAVIKGACDDLLNIIESLEI